MEQKNESSTWDFGPVYQFLQAFKPPGSPPPSPPAPVAPSDHDSKPYVPKSLGDFSQIFATLNSQPVDVPQKSNIQNESADSHSLPSSYNSEATLPSSAPRTDHFDDYISKTAKGVQWKDEVNNGDLTESRRRSTRATSKLLDPGAIVELSDGYSELSAPLIPSSIAHSAKSQRHIRPSSPIPLIFTDRTIVQPIYALTANEQKAKLIKKFLKKFGPEPDSLLKTDPELALPSGSTV